MVRSGQIVEQRRFAQELDERWREIEETRKIPRVLVWSFGRLEGGAHKVSFRHANNQTETQEAASAHLSLGSVAILHWVQVSLARTQGNSHSAHSAACVATLGIN